jgi:hypothetical protein
MSLPKRFWVSLPPMSSSSPFPPKTVTVASVSALASKLSACALRVAFTPGSSSGAKVHATESPLSVQPFGVPVIDIPGSAMVTMTPPVPSGASVTTTSAAAALVYAGLLVGVALETVPAANDDDGRTRSTTHAASARLIGVSPVWS